MSASAAGKSSGTVPPFNSIAIVSNKGSTVARSLAGEASITLLARTVEGASISKSALFRWETRFYTSRTRGSLGAREFSTNGSDGARTGASRSQKPPHARRAKNFRSELGQERKSVSYPRV